MERHALENQKNRLDRALRRTIELVLDFLPNPLPLNPQPIPIEHRERVRMERPRKG